MLEGKLLAIAVREKTRAEMAVLEQAEISADAGVADDFRGRPGDRQVTILSAKSWEEACEVVGKPLPWTVRRANLLVSGIELAETVGATVTIGDVVLKVTGETDPCHRMDEQCPGLRKALEPNWRGGVCCRVISGGSISIGQTVTLTATS